MIRYILLFSLTMAPLLAKPPHLVVSGEAEIYKSSDLATFTLGSVTEETTAAAAIELNAKRMETIQQAINRFNIEAQNIQTTALQLEPLYSMRPANPPADWTSTITGYRAKHLLTIRIDNLKILGPLIDATSRAGATHFESLQFTLSDARAAKNEAIAEATRNAMQTAQTMATAAEIKLGAIRRVTLNSTSEPVAYRTSFALSKNVATSIAPGDVEISASVSLEYEICDYCQ